MDFQPYIYQVRDKIKKGEIIGPRIFVAGAVLLNAGSYYACGDLKDEELKWCNDHVRLPMDTPAQARASVQELVKNKSDVVVFDGVTNQTVINKEVIKTIVDEAHKNNLKVLVHNTNAKDVNTMLDAGVDGTLLKRLGEQRTPIAVTLGFLERYSQILKT
ncbi:amidohydrolase family protein, partial [Acinetobacter portensis]|uniref:amidohydrolase family protein n=1 Tax=Acinetobacter portensis TaxID=1839785 RepID=UPI00165F70B4